MKGTVFDLLTLAAEKPEVARDLAELAAKHGIELSDEVSDDELDMVAGGVTSSSWRGGGGTQGEMTQMNMQDLQNRQQEMSQAMQTMSAIMKSMHDTQKSIINNLRA